MWKMILFRAIRTAVAIFAGSEFADSIPMNANAVEFGSTVGILVAGKALRERFPKLKKILPF